MKIAYVASFGNRFFTGVFRKIESQLAVWRSLPGVEVSLFFRASAGVTVPGGKAYPITGVPTCSYNASLFQDLVAFDPDIVYLRHEIAGPQILQIAKRFSGKIALEINADIDAELKLEGQTSAKRRLAYWVNTLTYRYLERHLGGCVCVSSDFLPLFSCVPRERKIVSPNCIDLTRHQVRKRVPGENERTALLFMGTPGQPWHGVDLLPPLASALPECDFHIVGPEPLPEATSNMYFYGYLPPEDFEALYARCHIGIGSLAFFRKNLHEASPLKVREYLAAGLPVFFSGKDSAFLGNTPEWVCGLAPGEGLFESPENIDTVRRFLVENREKIVTHEECAPYVDTAASEKRKIRSIAEWLVPDVKI